MADEKQAAGYAVECYERLDGYESRRRFEAPTLEEAVRLFHAADPPPVKVMEPTPEQRSEMDAALENAKLGSPVLLEPVATSLPPRWWELHHAECGVAYRGCHPTLCPKDQYEKTGVWRAAMDLKAADAPHVRTTRGTSP